MKIIDLLNKIANGEEVPRKIQIGCEILTLDDNKENYSYDKNDEYYGDKLIHWFDLNEEVKILEEEKKIPEKLPYYSLEKIQKAKNKDEWREERISLLEKRIDDYHNKINEIIDYLKSKGE